MSYTVYYNIPDTNDTHFIGNYEVNDPSLYIPKFLLLKMADYSNLKTKEKLEPVNLMAELNCLVQGFKFIGFLKETTEIKDIWNHVNQYLLNCTETDMFVLYNKLVLTNEEDYAPFTVMENVD